MPIRFVGWILGKFTLAEIRINERFTRIAWWRRNFFSLAVCITLLFPFTRQFFNEQGIRWLYMVLLSFSLCFFLTPIARFLAYKLNALDMPDGRKDHGIATPLLGGAAVFMAFSISIVANNIFSTELDAILVGALVLFVIGVVDDIYSVPAFFKLIAQIISASIAVYFGIILLVFPSDWGVFGYTCNIALTYLWIIGITNALNFFDGMDGMASGLGAIISFFLGVVAFQSDQEFLGWVAAAMMGSCLGFIPFNLLKRGRATIFLGDAGSTVIGYILACVAVYGDWNPGNHVAAIAAPILIFWVLIFDMVHISLDRIASGKVHNFREWIDYVGHDHLHHRIASVLGGKRRSVFFIYSLSICFGCSAVALRNASTLDAFVLLVQAVFLVALLTVLERSRRSSKC